MPIKGLTDRISLRPQLPRLGKLRKGGPKENDQFGKDLDHFRFTSNRPEVVKTFSIIYGEKPRIVNVYFPHASLEENFSTWIELWSGGGLQWRSDGEYQILWLEDGHYKRGKRPHVEHKNQAEVGRLEFIVPELIQAGHIGTVTLETHSNHDIRAIAGVLLAAEQEQERKRNALGLCGIPFVLRRVQEEISVPGWGKNEGKRARVEKWLVKLEPPPAMAIAALTSGKTSMDTATGEIVEEEVRSSNNLTSTQRAAFDYVTPGGKRLGEQTPDAMAKMIDFANKHADKPTAQVIKQHCEVLLDYLGQFETKEKGTNDDTD